MFKLKKLTDCKWLNLFEVPYKHKTDKEKLWLMSSRKANPITDAAKADAVMIIPIVKTSQGNRLAVIKEFRIPIWDYEYTFSAGLIDDGEDVSQTVERELREETGLEVVKINHISGVVYSTAGMSDESNYMVIVEAKGTKEDRISHPDEDIEVFLMDVNDIKELLSSNKEISAKAWGMLYHYALLGRIE